MAFIEQEAFTEADDITAEDQQSNVQETRQEQSQEQAEQTSVVDKVIPDKYKGKSVEDIVKMHQEAEKMIGRQAQEVHEVRSLADQLLKRQLEVDKKSEVVENTPEVDFFENPQTAVQRAIESNPAILEAKAAALELKQMKTAQKLAVVF